MFYTFCKTSPRWKENLPDTPLKCITCMVIYSEKSASRAFRVTNYQQHDTCPRGITDQGRQIFIITAYLCIHSYCFCHFSSVEAYFFMILHNICLTKETCIVTGSSKTTHYLQHMATRQVSCFFSLKFITKWTSSRYKGKLDKSLYPLHG